MTEEQVAIYCAGLFDGEGCITGGIANGGVIYLTLIVAMADREAVERFATRFKLKVHTDFPKDGRQHRYRVQASGRSAGQIALTILPFLCGKKPQAELAVLIAGTINPQGVALSEEVENRRLELIATLRSLNSMKGKSAICKGQDDVAR